MYRVVVIPADTTGCGTYRMVWPGQAVQQIRPDWEIEFFKPTDVRVTFDSFTGKLHHLHGIENLHEADLLVLQRVGSPVTLSLIQWAQQKGVAVIVDSDDALWAIDPKNTSFKAWNQPNGQHWRWNDQAMNLADLATVTTQFLEKRYSDNGRSEIIPNYVPKSVIKLDSVRNQFDDRPSFGWTGFVATHPNDLQVVGDAVARIMSNSELDAVVRIVGDAKGASEAWSIDPVLVDDMGSYPLSASYFQALSAVDVGLVPLEDSYFNDGKSWLKVLEYSAMGIPVIASPTPANLDLSQFLPIEIAKSPEEWFVTLNRLLRSPDERKQRGSEARRIVAEKFTIENRAEEWAQAYERAMNRRKLLNR